MRLALTALRAKRWDSYPGQGQAPDQAQIRYCISELQFQLENRGQPVQSVRNLPTARFDGNKNLAQIGNDAILRLS